MNKCNYVIFDEYSAAEKNGFLMPIPVCNDCGAFLNRTKEKSKDTKMDIWECPECKRKFIDPTGLL